MIKTFRGLLADGGQDRIRLSTIKGKVGYRIVKFQLFAITPGAAGYESIVKVYKSEQTTIDGTVNFTDSDLLAVSYLEGDGAPHYTDKLTTIFDREIVNQDMYITHHEDNGALQCNYYMELEVIPLDDKGAEYMTIKDLRTRGF